MQMRYSDDHKKLENVQKKYDLLEKKHIDLTKDFF